MKKPELLLPEELMVLFNKWRWEDRECDPRSFGEFVVDRFPEILIKHSISGEQLDQFEVEQKAWENFQTVARKPVYPRTGFALNSGDFDLGAGGITLIDYFAGKSLTGLAGANPNLTAELAYDMAEVMIREKIKRGY